MGGTVGTIPFAGAGAPLVHWHCHPTPNAGNTCHPSQGDFETSSQEHFPSIVVTGRHGDGTLNGGVAQNYLDGYFKLVYEYDDAHPTRYAEGAANRIRLCKKGKLDIDLRLQDHGA